jgi:hypothetical protein
MKNKQKINATQSSYSVYETDTFKRALDETYNYLVDNAERYRDNYPNDWLKTVKNHLQKMELGNPPSNTLGTIDPQHFSDKYAYVNIKDTHTTVFFHVEGDAIHLITCGKNDLPWAKIMQNSQYDQTLENALDKSLDEARKKRGGNLSPDDAGAVLNEPTPDNNPQTPDKPRRDDRGDID